MLFLLVLFNLPHLLMVNVLVVSDENYMISELERVGAWWMGFPILSAFLLLAGMIFFWFPQWFKQPDWLKRRKERLKQKLLSQKKQRVLASKHRKHSQNRRKSAAYRNTGNKDQNNQRGNKENNKSDKHNTDSTDPRGNKEEDKSDHAKENGKEELKITDTLGIDVITIPEPALPASPETGSLSLRDNAAFEVESETDIELVVTPDRVNRADNEPTGEATPSPSSAHRPGAVSNEDLADAIEVIDEGRENPAFEGEGSNLHQRNGTVPIKKVRTDKKNTEYTKRKQSAKSNGQHRKSSKVPTKYTSKRRYVMRREQCKGNYKHLHRLIPKIIVP